MVLTRFEEYKARDWQIKTNHIMVLESLLQPNACIQHPMLTPNKETQGAGLKQQSLCGMQYALYFTVSLLSLPMWQAKSSCMHDARRPQNGHLSHLLLPCIPFC